MFVNLAGDHEKPSSSLITSAMFLASPLGFTCVRNMPTLRPSSKRTIAGSSKSTMLAASTAVVGTQQRGTRRLVLAFFAVAADASVHAEQEFAAGHEPAAEATPRVLQRARVHRDWVAPRCAAVDGAHGVRAEPAHQLEAPRPVAVRFPPGSVRPRRLLGADPTLEVPGDREVDQQGAVFELADAAVPVSGGIGERQHDRAIGPRRAVVVGTE